VIGMTYELKSLENGVLLHKYVSGKLVEQRYLPTSSSLRKEEYLSDFFPEHFVKGLFPKK
jgi:hypothetical protein